MAIKLSDCPPALYDAIMRQLEREGIGIPKVQETYCMVYQVGSEWRSCPESENYVAVAKQVSKMNGLNGRTAAQALRGNPVAVMVKVTRTATLGAAMAPLPIPKARKIKDAPK